MPSSERADFDVRDLLRAEAYPHEVAGLRLVETHISWVLLTGPYAYKIKQPVRFDFLDASSAGRREQLCHEEIRLNRRFAPELYLDVVPILSRDGHLWIGGAGPVCDHAVRMRQFDPAQQLDQRIQSGSVTAADLRSFASELARLHAAAPAAGSEGVYGSAETLRRHIMDNLPPLRTRLQAPQQRQRLERLQGWLDNALAELRHMLGLRLAAGRVRECHGDLHAGNIVCWRGRWLPFDCIEFDAQLRWIDVMNDVAFLYMDLCRLGRRDLACAFLSRYLEESGDYDGVRLLRLYAVYRALVRAKVEALGPPVAADVDAGRERRLAGWLATALRLTQPRELALVIMHGVTGSGKSLLSEALVPVLGAVRIRSDLERKRLEGVPAAMQRSQQVDSGSYSPAMTGRTYERLLANAAAVLEGGLPVIIDATFLERRWRDAAGALARRLSATLLIVDCRADQATLRLRLRQRRERGMDASEATPAVLESQLAAFRALDDDERPCSLELDTCASTVEAMLDCVRSRLIERIETGVDGGDHGIDTELGGIF